MDVSLVANTDLERRGAISRIDSSTGAITTLRYSGEIGTGELFSYGEVQLDVTMNGKTGSATTTVVGDTLTYEYEDPVVTVVYDNPFVLEELYANEGTLYPLVAEYSLRRNTVIASTGEVVMTTVIDGDLDDPGDATFEFLLWDVNELMLTTSIDPWNVDDYYHDGKIDVTLEGKAYKDLVKEFPIYIILKVTVNGKTGYGACGPLEIVEGMYVWEDPIVSLSYGLPLTINYIEECDYDIYPREISYTQAYNCINPKTGAIISSVSSSGTFDNPNGATFTLWMSDSTGEKLPEGYDCWAINNNNSALESCEQPMVGVYDLYICLLVTANGKTGYAWDGPIEVVEDDDTYYTLSFAMAAYITGNGVYNTIPAEGGTFSPTITVLKNTFVDGKLTGATAVTPSNITYALAVNSRYCTLDVTTGEITIMANDRSSNREFTINVTAYYSDLSCSTTITLTLPTGLNTDPFISGSLSYITSAGTNIIPVGGGTFEPTIELYLNSWSGSAWIQKSLALSDCDAAFTTEVGTITEEGVLTLNRIIGGSDFTVTMGLDYDYNGTTLSFDTSVDLAIEGNVTVEPI